MPKSPVKEEAREGSLPTDRLATMEEAMAYLTQKGFPCRSRKNFPRFLEREGIRCIDVNRSEGRYMLRRFSPDELQSYVKRKGLEP